MDVFSEKIYDINYTGLIHLDDAPEGLIITADEGDAGAAVSVTLSLSKVKQLRLALARYERRMARIQ